MPNLVGIGNSQVPTNAMLGGLAYQDSVGEIDIEKIKARTEDTAKDIFVYDTSKDSDGGAWRKRTQNTSWYNESASSTRGARKEFPTVAIIVVEAYQVTIYDADDPNCPMWMVFNQSSTNLGAMVGYSNMTIGCCTMLNGILMVGLDHTAQGNVAGLRLINFISEHHHWKANITGRHSSQHWPIVDRNGGKNNVNVDSNLIVNEVIHDVDAIVLPSAQTDASTGLPIPTIVIATNGGISVITDSGVVYDLTTNNETPIVKEIAFLADTRYSFATAANNTRWWIDDIQTADENHNYFYQRTSYDYSSGGQGSINHLGRVNGTSRGEYGEAIFRQASGMSRIRYVDQLLNHTTTDYNTGWMGGEVEGALLSSIDDTNLVASSLELVTNGTFASDSDWTKDGSWTISGGTATNSGSGNINQTIAVVSGKRYLMTATMDFTGDTSLGNTTIGFRTAANDNYYAYANTATFTANTVNQLQVYWTSTVTGNVLARCYSADGVSIDNWSVQTVDGGNADRSSNNKGFKVSGTITATPVATGAELVAYSGYSYNNYLDNPSLTAPGTGDFTITAWIKPGTNGSGTGNYFHLFNMGKYNVTGQNSATGFVLKMATNGSGGYSPYLYNNDGGTSHGTYDTNNRIPLGTWSQLIGMRRDGRAYLYLNGRLLITGSTWTTNLTDTYVSLFRAPGFSNEVGGDAQVALVRYSLDAPSAEEIKRIYDDEKLLFQENAKCTLYGTSNSVTALAYDDTKNILHAGTSSGRSEFRGLNRINNTTTAVTTAISASNGLVAEQ